MQDPGPPVEVLVPVPLKRALTPQDMFKLVQPDPHCTRTLPGHVSTRSVLSPDCQQVSSWHSTESPACVFNVILLRLLYYVINIILILHVGVFSLVSIR